MADLRDPDGKAGADESPATGLIAMKQGPKPAEPRMEDVLASIRRAIDENAAAMPPDRFGGSMAELRVKPDRPVPAQDNRPRRDFDYNANGSSQGFAGILGTRRNAESLRRAEPVERQPEPLPLPAEDEGQYVYDGYYGAQVAEYTEPAAETYEPGRPQSPQRYLPSPTVADQRQGYAAEPGLMSEASSEATQAAFNHLAETITRRALGDLPISDIAHELLRGMLKEWLDNNLPKIVERLVREEIERVVRRPQR
jgi:cell pole-organizing protein PopZ